MSREADIIQALEREGSLRSLTCWNRGSYVNFSSNDYLGIGADARVQRRFLAGVDFEQFQLGNPASRLMTGNSPEYERLERQLAQVLGMEAALVVGSGYAANSGVLPAVTQAGDVVLADRLVHASLAEGLRLCGRGVHWERFRHNDMEHLEQLLRRYAGGDTGTGTGRVIVVTESLFSMDGDFAPLDRLARLQRGYGFRLYLDEAHAFGVYGAGESGAGCLAAYNARNPEELLRADYLVVTFGKAMAAQGAAVGCSAQSRELLVNRMRPLIFSTALPPITLAWVGFLVERLPEFGPERARLWRGVERLREVLGAEAGGAVASQIVPIAAGSNERVLCMAAQLREQGLWATAIRYPTVPRGQERLRISITAAHSLQQIEKLGELCRRYF